MELIERGAKRHQLIFTDKAKNIKNYHMDKQKLLLLRNIYPKFNSQELTD